MASSSESIPLDPYVGLRDEEIVALAKDDADAMEYVLIKYRSLIYARMRGYFLPGGGQDDLLQEGLIGLLKAVRDFRPDRGTSFQTFAGFCVTRQILTAVKTATRQKHAILNESISLERSLSWDGDYKLLDVVLGDESAEPSRAVEGEIMADCIREAIYRNLSPLEATVLNAYLHKHTYADIARELHRGRKCIDNALQRAKRKIGNLILEVPAAIR